MSGIKETFGLISEAISTMAESGSDWPYTLAGALLLLTVVAHCAIKISTWIGDNAYSRQQKRLSRLSSVVPEFLRTLVFARPRGDDQFADCTFSPSLDMSR